MVLMVLALVVEADASVVGIPNSSVPSLEMLELEPPP